MSNDSGALVPTEERAVDFYGDQIKGGIVIHPPSESAVYVPIRPLADLLGVDWRGQRQRLQRDPALSEEMRMVVLSTPGGLREMLCLPLDFLNGWLFSISAGRVRDEIRERLIRCQRECYKVLAEAFREPLLPEHPLAQTEQMGLAIASLAREQMRFEQDPGKLAQRTVALEEWAAPGEPVTQEQASQIRQAAKAIAMKISKLTDKNEYGKVYSELYRKFGITSYMLLPATKFDEVMEFLSEWWRRVAVSDDVSF